MSTPEHDIARTAVGEALKATPAASVLVAKAQGVTFTADDLATYLAITFLTMQILWFGWEKVILPRWRARRGQ